MIQASRKGKIKKMKLLVLILKLYIFERHRLQFCSCLGPLGSSMENVGPSLASIKPISQIKATTMGPLNLKGRVYTHPMTSATHPRCNTCSGEIVAGLSLEPWRSLTCVPHAVSMARTMRRTCSYQATTHTQTCTKPAVEASAARRLRLQESSAFQRLKQTKRIVVSRYFE